MKRFLLNFLALIISMHLFSIAGVGAECRGLSINIIPVQSYKYSINEIPTGEYVYRSSGQDWILVSWLAGFLEDNMAAVIVKNKADDGIALTSDQHYAYVIDHIKRCILVIRTSDNTVMNEISIGGILTSLNEIKISPDDAYVYVGSIVRLCIPVKSEDGKVVSSININQYSLSIIRTIDDTVVQTISLGSKPCGVAISPYGDYAYITSFQNHTVTIKNLLDNTVIKTIPYY